VPEGLVRDVEQNLSAPRWWIGHQTHRRRAAIESTPDMPEVGCDRGLYYLALDSTICATGNGPQNQPHTAGDVYPAWKGPFQFSLGEQLKPFVSSAEDAILRTNIHNHRRSRETASR
jgi:hypothetical protein